MDLTLDSPVALVPFIGPAYARRLDKLNIETVEDLLYHFPFRYDDFSLISKIGNLQEGETVTVQGEILDIKNEYTRGRMVIQKARVQDDTGILDVLWFNQKFLPGVLQKGDKVSLSGKIERQGRRTLLKSPQYEKNTSLHTGRLVPVYPETFGVSSKWLRNRISFLLKTVEIPDPYPANPPLCQALNSIHFPESYDEIALAQNRLSFDEILLFTLQSKTRRRQWQSTVLGHRLKIIDFRPQLETFVKNLPFKLTRSQKDTVSDIFSDLAKDQPMNRLLQGDVGSGKTVVAALAMLATYLNGFQAILMAPTEILAFQHFDTISQMLKPLNLKIGLVTGSHKNYKNLDILVGTHALLNNKTDINRLGLVVIDEQHRFGVEQRTALIQKAGRHMPHVLTMTATPIPRTIALTVFGDLDISVITEMPIGRLPITTWALPSEKRTAAYDWIRKQKTQTFIICPFIEESESLQTVKSAKIEFEKIKNIFPKLRVGLLHGKLKPREKNLVLAGFKNSQIDILVATPVVEVGVDVPGATIMVIEDADRFGLAQLHQLRGRVGRRHQKSYCLLFANNLERVKILETVADGLTLAEADLKYRGPGDLFGTVQHGKFAVKLAAFDPKIIIDASAVAAKIYPHLNSFPLLKKKLEKVTIDKVSPN